MTQQNSFFRLISSEKNVSLKNTISCGSSSIRRADFKQQDKKIVHIAKQNFSRWSQITEWRIKTDFPIVKVLNFKKLSPYQKNNQPILKIPLQLTLEPIALTIKSLDQIPFHKVCYLLKEALVGAQRLCHQYGNFILKDSMVGINEAGKCKIWYNSKFYINQAEFPCLNQEQTVNSVVQVFIMRTKKSAKSIQFYRQLLSCKTFCACLEVIKRQSSHCKLVTSSPFMLSNHFISLSCSPKKFTNRPSSCFRGQDSCEFVSQRNRNSFGLSKNTDVKATNEKTFFMKDSKFTCLSSKRMSSNQPQIEKDIKKKQSKREFPIYLKKKNQKKNLPQIAKIQLMQSAKIPELKEVESIHENDEDEDQSNAAYHRPSISNMCFVIPELCRNSKIEKELCISSLLIDDREDACDFDDIAEFLNKNLESTLDNTTLLSRKDGLNTIFHTPIKQIDKSYDDELHHQY